MSHTVIAALRMNVDTDETFSSSASSFLVEIREAIPVFTITNCICFSYRATAHAVNCWLLIAEPWVQ
jgi:hypothetical protein